MAVEDLRVHTLSHHTFHNKRQDRQWVALVHFLLQAHSSCRLHPDAPDSGSGSIPVGGADETLLGPPLSSLQTSIPLDLDKVLLHYTSPLTQAAEEPL